MAELTLEQLAGGFICRACGDFVCWNTEHRCPRLRIWAAALAPRP